MRFSDQEVRDLLLAWVLVSVAFALALGSTGSLLMNIWMSGLTVGIAFLAHELAHKYAAQYFHKFAEFRANIPMLILMLVVSLLGVVIAAPGAVLISGFVDRRQSGLIASAGPLINIALAIIMMVLLFIVPTGSMAANIVGFAFLINAWLALFNMIPFGPFDGAKVIAWDKKIYAAMVVVSVILLFFGQVVRPV